MKGLTFCLETVSQVFSNVTLCFMSRSTGWKLVGYFKYCRHTLNMFFYYYYFFKLNVNHCKLLLIAYSANVINSHMFKSVDTWEELKDIKFLNEGP